MRNFKTWVVIGLTTLALTSPADAAQRDKKKEEPPPQFRVSEPTRPMKFSRANNEVPTGTLIGKYEGVFCPGPSLPVYSEHAFKGVPTSDYAEAFTAEARKAGYNLAGDQGSLFETQTSKDPDLLVGAVIKSLSVKGCKENNFNGDGTSESVMTVDWQVFDPLEKKLVYRATIDGKSKVTAPANFMTIQSARKAFEDSIRTMLADPKFVEAVRDTSGKATPPSDSLFPEATNSAPPPTAQHIPLVPLKTATFKEALPDLQAQVVTVRMAVGTGSGFHIGNGLWITNHHVAGGSRKVRLRFNGGREIEADVLTSDARRDVALLHSESIGMAGLPLRTSGLAVADKVYVIGSPRGEKQEGSVSFGVVSAFRERQGQPMIQSDAQTTGGNSGGPMFDEYGNVVGITVSGIDGTQVNFYIPIGDALDKLGIAIDPAPQAAAAPVAKKASTRP